MGSMCGMPGLPGLPYGPIPAHTVCLQACSRKIRKVGPQEFPYVVGRRPWGSLGQLPAYLPTAPGWPESCLHMGLDQRPKSQRAFYLKSGCWPRRFSLLQDKGVRTSPLLSSDGGREIARSSSSVWMPVSP